LARPDMNSLLESFEHRGRRITNYEMESSAVAGLSALLGHKAMTVCLVIANRLVHNATTDYGKAMDTLINTVLERI
jgi:uridine phosphorylase